MASQSAGHEIHIIAGNSSPHNTKQVAVFLESTPFVQLHFTLTYSLWLNQVELWLSKIARDLIARGIFISIADLARQYIGRYNRETTPVRWTYRDPMKRIA